MAADIRGILYGLWYNFRGVVIVIYPVCEFVAKTRDFGFEAFGREYDFVAKTREYGFIAEDKCD